MNWETISAKVFEFATTWGGKILGALIILIVGLKVTKALVKWLRKSPKLDKLDDSLRSFLSSFTSIALYAILVIVIASIIGIPATSFITVLATCGAAIGLALQGSLSNFAGGLMILLFKPFKVGDYIEASGESGVVSEISVVYTELLTLDNKRITIPNGALTNSVIENYSSEELRRVDLNFSAAYTCDIKKVKEVISGIVENHPKALKKPEPFVRVSECADSALTYTVRVWCKNSDYWDVYFDVLEGVKEAFDKNGIEIPYKQIDVHVDNK